jgi:hypothetical protein
MRYRLRTLLIVLALAPPVLAGVLIVADVWIANTPWVYWLLFSR